MKKALVISSYPAPYRVGVFFELSKEYDLDIFFCTSKNEDRNAAWFCKSGELKFDILNTEENVDKFNKALKNIKKYDFVIAYDPSLKFAMKAIALCRVKRVPYYVNNDGAFIKKNFIKDSVKKFLYRGAKACFAAGEASNDYYKYYGVKEKRIYIHNFSSLYRKDILSEPKDRREKEEMRASLGLDNKFTVISVGQFIYRKGFDVLLDAWKDIGNTARLLIIGGGGERKAYEDQIEKHGIKGVKIIDFMPKQELFKYYMASDLFVLPTREDVWGLVVNEAMSVGLPVITTDRCNAGRQLIDNGKNGYIVPADDSELLGRRITELICDPALCDEMAANNIERIKEFTIEDVAESHIRAIKETL